MKIDQQTVTGADGSSVDCGHFNNGLYSTYLQLCVKTKKGTQYILHGYVKSNKNGTITCEDASAEVTTEWNHVEMVVIPSTDNLEVCFYPGEFWLYNWKLEIGSTASDWTPSPLDAKYDLISIGSTVEQLSDKITQKVWQEDINNVTGEIEKKYAQTVIDANKINWIVASGEDISSMTLTKDFYTIVSKNIDITGKVTFDSFSSALQTRWDDLNDTANNADDVATEAKNTANDIIDNIYTTNTTTIDGGKITTNSITADKLNVNDLIAISASIAGWKINNTNGIYSEYLDSSTNIIYTTKISADTPYNFGVYAGDEPNFYVSRNGFLYAKDCNLSGSINTKSGSIANFTIDEDGLCTTSLKSFCSFFINNLSDFDYETAVNNRYLMQYFAFNTCLFYVDTIGSLGAKEITTNKVTINGVSSANESLTVSGNVKIKGGLEISNAAYFTDPSKIEISHYGQTKHPAMYTRNPISFDWDGSWLRIYVDNTIVASWSWDEARWE